MLVTRGSFTRYDRQTETVRTLAPAPAAGAPLGRRSGDVIFTRLRRHGVTLCLNVIKQTFIYLHLIYQN